MNRPPPPIASSGADAPRLVVVGAEAMRVVVAGDVVREDPALGRGGLDRALSGRLGTVVVTGEGEACFFRASAAAERGAARIVVRPGALGADALEALAARAAHFDAELWLRGDDPRAAARRKPTPGARPSDPGSPDVGAWRAASEAAAGDAGRAAEVGLVVDDVLRGEIADARPLGCDVDADQLSESVEERAFAIGQKPVLYLVLAPEAVEATLARHPGAHAAALEGVLHVDPATGVRRYGDGAGAVHLFLSRDRALAEEARDHWRVGSSARLREIGRLMGYPSCCVAAFEGLASRAHNAALTYVVAARTRALGASFAWPLNHVAVRVAPFTSCTYGCPRAVVWAERVVASIDAPEARERYARALRRPVLYLDEARALAFEGARWDEPRREMSFEVAKWLPGNAAPHTPFAMHARRLFGWLLEGATRLRVDPGAFVAAGAPHGERAIARDALGLGVVLPFAVE